MQHRQQHKAMVFCLMAVVSLLLIGCSQAQASEEVIKQQWLASAHADADSRAFTFWDEEDFPQIPSGCAKCHSTGGYLSYLGADGSTAGKVSQGMPPGSTIECEVCHNEVASTKETATMPSGEQLVDLDQSANCMECHQGRADAVKVAEAIGSREADIIDADLSLPLIHNNPAAPTQYGAEAKGGYEYEGRTYLGLYQHTPEFDTCIACHDPHTLATPVEKCRACHVEATSQEGLQDIRMGKTDYDGDGDRAEGIAGEIETMQERLRLAIQFYAARTKGVDEIVYDDERNPYFFDQTGQPYSTWTPRLLRAAYNYRYATTGVGEYAHNGRYTLQLLYDSLDDLGVNTSTLTRPGVK